MGNRTHQSYNGAQTYYEHNAANALTQLHDYPADAWTYWSYDGKGNCIQIQAPNGTTYFGYNGLNLMTSVLFRNGVANYFWYDARQRRYAIQESTGTTYFTYDSDGLLSLYEKDHYGQTTAQNTRGYAPVKGIGDRAGGSVITHMGLYEQFDASGLTGNIVRMTDAGGGLSGSFEYNAWGLKLQNSPPQEGTRYGFSAPAYITPKDDPDRGVLIWTPTRDYYAGAGRFLQRDPLGFVNGGSPYEASMAPLAADPTGMSSIASFEALSLCLADQEDLSCDDLRAILSAWRSKIPQRYGSRISNAPDWVQVLALKAALNGNPVANSQKIWDDFLKCLKKHNLNLSLCTVVPSVMGKKTAYELAGFLTVAVGLALLKTGPPPAKIGGGAATIVGAALLFHGTSIAASDIDEAILGETRKRLNTLYNTLTSPSAEGVDLYVQYYGHFDVDILDMECQDIINLEIQMMKEAQKAGESLNAPP